MTITAPPPTAPSGPRPPSPSSSSGRGSGDGDRSSLSIFAVLTAVTAFLFAVLGLVAVSVKDSGSPASAGSAGSAATTVEITLSEFKINPEMIEAPAGPVTLKVKNAGTMAHNLTITSLNKKTADIAAGATATLDLGDVKAGNYDVLCTIAGHADSGMKAMLMVGSSGSSSGASASDSSASSSSSSGETSAADMAAMNTRMEAGMKAGLDTFTKGNATQGVGNQKLVPTTEPDGTKVFSLTASIIDWQVAPGKTVKAWAYNGMVPGPWIRTEPGDHVKVVIKNELPVDTDIHFHGISTPFPDDGVAPLTQDFIKPGATFTYDWVNGARPELGMYHAHFMGNDAVINGMFAVFQVGDVALPAGRTIDGITVPKDLAISQELPIVLNDAGTIGLSLNGKSYPATAPIVANPGDALLVHYYNEGLLSHPMHLHRVPQLVVAKDGFALEQPYWADTINIAPGERYSVLVMPGATDIGVWAWHCHILNHAEGPDGLTGMVTALIVNDPAKKS